jgi:hypothetical protein
VSGAKKKKKKDKKKKRRGRSELEEPERCIARKRGE